MIARLFTVGPASGRAHHVNWQGLDHCRLGGTAPPTDPALTLSMLVEARGQAAFSELEQALARPHSQWLPPLEEVLRHTPAILIETPWYRSSHELSSILTLRIHLALATSNTERFIQTCQILQRWSQGFKEHGTIQAFFLVSPYSLSINGGYMESRKREEV